MYAERRQDMCGGKEQDRDGARVRRDWQDIRMCSAVEREKKSAWTCADTG